MNGDSSSDESAATVSRRTFLRSAGATAGAAGAAAAGVTGSDDAAAQETQRYEFGGEVQGWQGRAPPEIEGETNPTVELEAGTEYTFWFENIDGAPHNIAVQDSEGNTLVESDTVSAEGATASVTFTATSQMAQYICLVHPTTMVGDAQITGEVEGGGGGGDQGPSVETLLMVGALVMAFVSPVLFALFLFSRRGGEGGEGDLPAR